MPNNQIDWPDLFKNWFVPLISIVGFGQYWIGIGVNSLLHRVRGDVVQAIAIERNSLGDWLIFRTSLLASRRNVVVSQMNLTVHRLQDKAQATTELDSLSFQALRSKSDELEYPRSFRLAPMEPLFVSPRFRLLGNGLDVHVPELNHIWTEFVAIDKDIGLKINEQRESTKIDEGFVTKLILDFTNYCITTSSVYDRLVSGVFWQKSDYRARLEFRIVGRRTTVKQHFQFSIDENQSKLLQKNAIVLIHNVVRSQFGMEAVSFDGISTHCVAVKNI